MCTTTSVVEFRAASQISVQDGATAFAKLFNDVREKSPNRCPRVTFRMLEGVVSEEGLTQDEEQSIELARQSVLEPQL